MNGKHTPGPWAVFIDDSGDEWTGWPLSIYAVNDEDKSVVRPGGQWPYAWDAAMSQREAVANAHLIAAAPNLLAALYVAREAIVTGFNTVGAVAEINAAIARATGEKP